MTWEEEDASSEMDPARLLAAEAQSVDQALVAVAVVPLEVVEQPAPLPHELQQPAAGVVVFGVGLEMLR